MGLARIAGGSGTNMAAPTFTAGQVLSATFHVNGLQRYVHGVRDTFFGYQMPIPGCAFVDRPFNGAFRHKINSLDYDITLGGGTFPWRLYVNNSVRATFNSAGDYSGTLDLTALGLTVNEFYEVSIKDGTGALRVNKLCQSQAAIAGPLLASFADGTTPSAAEWQALSTYAVALEDRLLVPQATFPVVRARPADPGALQLETKFAGTMIHRCRYLAYSFYQVAPYYDGDDDGDPWVSTFIGINGTGILHRRTGRPTTAGPGLDFDQSVDNGEWSGLVDLDTYPGTLTPGEEYVLTVTSQGSTTEDVVVSLRLDYLYEAPAPVETLPGWTNFETWQHGDYAWGNANPGPGTRQIVTIKDNLEALGATTTAYINPVTAEGEASTGAVFTDLYGVRRHRYLHYRNDAGRNVTLVFDNRGEEQTVGMPDASERWLALDLESVEGLWPGTQYHLREALYAIEDEEA